MASWSAKRRFGYFLIFVVGLGVIAAVPFFFFFYEAPTCADGKRNGGEKGIDCGGSCQRLCPADYLAPRVLWSYSMQIAPGIYNSLAYVENPNQGVTAESGYTFKLYDAKGLLVTERKGRTSVPAGQKFAVFAGGIRTGERTPARTTFELEETLEWKRGVQLSGLRVLSIDLEQGETPKAKAKVSNDTVDRAYSDIDAFIVLYDGSDNRLAFSKTLIEKISPGQAVELYFTWPSAFLGQAVRSEILFAEKR